MKSKLIIVAILFLISLVIVVFGYALKRTNGLFFSRTPKDFINDRFDSKFEQERNYGEKISCFIINWVVPLSLGLFILMLLIAFKMLFN